MDTNQPITTAEAVKHFLKNSRSVNLDLLVATMASREPQAFLEFIQKAFNIDPADFVGEMAKCDPVKFMDLIERSKGTFDGIGRSINFMLEGNKVDSIKECRQTFGLGLKEAKDVIDKLHEELAKMGKCAVPSYSAPHLNAELTGIFNEIMTHYRNYMV